MAFETIGMAAAVADDKQLSWRHAAGAREHVVHGHRLGDREMLVGRILRRRHRAAVGVALDADELLRIVLHQIGGNARSSRIGTDFGLRRARR